MKRKHTNYLDSSRDYKKKETFRLKRSIEKVSHILGGKFYTHDYIPKDSDGLAWADIYFLSKKHKNVFYNATILTLKTKTMDEIDAMAWDRADKICNVYVDFNEKDSEEILKAFGGMTRYKWLEKEIDKMIENEEYPYVCEEIKLHTDYAYGIGMTAYLDVESLTIDSINKFIDTFIQNGEIPFRSDKCKRFTKDQVKSFPLDTANEIIDPKDWPL